MPKFKSEADKQRWKDKCAATRISNKGVKRTMAPGLATRSTGIAGAIDEIDSKIAALEGVKTQLRHAQELVNL